MKTTMTIASLVMVCLAIGYAVWAGEGKSRGTTSQVDSVEGPDPVTMGEIAKDRIPEAEADLRKLERAIDQVAEKLERMKAAAAKLRASIAAAGAPGDRVFRTAEMLFADMPRDAFPKAGPEGGLERAATRAWLKETFTPSGRVIEFPITVEKVDIQGNGPFRVYVYPEAETLMSVKNNWSGLVLDDRLKLGDQPCKLLLGHISRCVTAKELFKSPRVCGGWVGGNSDFLEFQPCTAEEARLLRSFKGKSVKLRGVVERADLWDAVKTGRIGVTIKDLVAISVSFRRISINGFVPQAVKAANGK